MHQSYECAALFCQSLVKQRAQVLKIISCFILTVSDGKYLLHQIKCQGRFKFKIFQTLKSNHSRAETHFHPHVML